MKNMLILIPRFGIGGISKIGSFITNTYHRNGYHCICCSLFKDEVSVDFDTDIKLLTLDYKINCCNGSYHSELLNKIRVLYKLRMILIKNHIDIICTLGTDLMRIAVIAKVLLKCKIVASERGNPFAYTPKQYNKYLRAMKRCNIIVFQTEKARTAFAPIRSKSTVIPNPAVLRFKKINNLIIDDRQKKIIACGRLSKEKNFKLLIDAFSQITDSTYTLSIYGDGEEYLFLDKYISSKGLNGRISIIRDCKDVFSLEYNASIFVLSSDTEGMPNALMEALLLGIPCIATDCPSGGVNELMGSGKRGLLVPVGDVHALTAAIQFYIDNPTIAANYGILGKEIKDQYNAERISLKWLEVIEQIE